jgi:hypothetical protein
MRNRFSADSREFFDRGLILLRSIVVVKSLRDE